MNQPSWWFFGPMFLVLAALPGLAFVSSYWNWPCSPALAVIAGGGLFACAVLAVVAGKMKRLFGAVDGIRCTGWILIGCSCPFSLAFPYAYACPPIERALIAGSLVGLLTGAMVVVFASLLLPTPTAQRPGHCQACGYSLTGNTSGVCPECGERI